MKKILTNLMLSLTLMFGFSAIVVPRLVSADAVSDICTGVGIAASDNSSDCNTPQGGRTVESTIGLVVNILSVIVGVVAVIMIIIGGLRYITSGGDSNSVSGAKNSILYAIIGLVIVALAQVIVRFVVNKVK